MNKNTELVGSKDYHGKTDCNIDENGTLTIPQNLRKVYEEHYRCKITSIKGGVGEVERLGITSHYLSLDDEELNSLNFEVDGRGRILIPKPLRKIIGLEDRALVVGISSGIEIWSPEIFHQYVDNYSKQLEQERHAKSAITTTFFT